MKPSLQIASAPSGRHVHNCKTCGNEFSTKYYHQKYCMNPCTRFYVEKKSKKVRPLIQINAEERRKSKIVEEQKRTINAQYWLTQHKL